MRKKLNWQEGDHFRTRNIFIRGRYLAYFVRNYGESVPIVYSAILANTNTASGHAEISDALLSNQTGLHRGTIRTAIKILSAHYLIEVQDKSRGRPTYRVTPLHEDCWRDILALKSKLIINEKTDENIQAQHGGPSTMYANLEVPDNEENPGEHGGPSTMLPVSTWRMKKNDIPVSEEKQTISRDRNPPYNLYNNLNSLNKNISKYTYFLSVLPEKEDEKEETIEEKKRRIIDRIEPYRKGMSAETYQETISLAFLREGIEGIE